jgi:hypothetical protein
MLVQLHNAAYHAGILLKAAVPIRVGEHNVGSAVDALLIRGVEEAAKPGLYLEHVEVIATGGKAGGEGRILAYVEAYKGEVVSRQGFKAVIAIAQIEIVGIRLPPWIIPVLGSVEILGLRHIQRAEDQAIEDTEDHGVGANRQCQREHSGEGESGRLAQLAYGVSQVL